MNNNHDHDKMTELIHITESCVIKNGQIVKHQNLLLDSINLAIRAGLIERGKIKGDIKELKERYLKLKEEEEFEKFTIEMCTFEEEYSQELKQKIKKFNQDKLKVKQDLDDNTEMLHALAEQKSKFTGEF
jgi:hypothetical protein